MPENWQELNRKYGLVKEDDCQTCDGMGRVPGVIEQTPLFKRTSWRQCPACLGTGKRTKETDAAHDR